MKYLCILLILLTACTPRPDYNKKIARYQGQEGLTMQEKQELYMAEKVKRAKE